MGDKSTLAILVPVANVIEPKTQAALGDLVNRGYVVRTLRGCSQVDLARSILASDALRDGFTETFWIDSDTDFNPNDVERVRAHNLPFVAGLYVKKGKPEFAAKFREGLKSVTFGEGGGLLAMEYVGFGFTYVKAEVYQIVAVEFKFPACTGGYDPAKPISPYFLPMLVPDGNGGTCYLSEDYSFCHRARRCGYPAWADTRIRLGHISGNYVYTWDDMAPRQTFSSLQFSVEIPEKQGEGSNGEYSRVVRAADGEARGRMPVSSADGGGPGRPEGRAGVAGAARS